MHLSTKREALANLAECLQEFINELDDDELCGTPRGEGNVYGEEYCDDDPPDIQAYDPLCNAIAQARRAFGGHLPHFVSIGHGTYHTPSQDWLWLRRHIEGDKNDAVWALAPAVQLYIWVKEALYEFT